MSDDDMCAREYANQKRNDYAKSFIFLDLACGQRQSAIAAEGLMGYGRGILPPYYGV
jgi:hypothetical protein